MRNYVMQQYIKMPMSTQSLYMKNHTYPSVRKIIRKLSPKLL